jgi:hypothetical protein
MLEVNANIRVLKLKKVDYDLVREFLEEIIFISNKSLIEININLEFTCDGEKFIEFLNIFYKCIIILKKINKLVE